MTLSSLELTSERGCKQPFFAVEREMGNRVSKSTILESNVIVKEQRVDGRG